MKTYLFLLLILSIFSICSAQCPFRITGGDNHSGALKSDGTVWTWGRNNRGQLGDGTFDNSSIPLWVADTSFIDLDNGSSHTLAIKSDSTVWAWGMNYYGQLGDRTEINKTTPIQVLEVGGHGYLDDVIDIAGGSNHSVALKSDGTVITWGSNIEGQLGDGTDSSRNVPVQVVGEGGIGYLDDIIAIAAGGRNTIALKSDSTLLTWGRNFHGQLGDGSNDNSDTPVQVLGPGGVGYLDNIIAISAGGNHTLALKSDGSVWAFGMNSYGQLGDGTNDNSNTPVQVVGPDSIGYLTGAVRLDAGSFFSAVLKNDGSVWTFGDNEYGQLGNGLTGTTYNSDTPVQVVGPGSVGTLTDVFSIACGGRHMLAIKSDSTLWAWGDNYDGRLGDGTETDSDTPVQSLLYCGFDYSVNVGAALTDICIGDSTSLNANIIGFPDIYQSYGWTPSEGLSDSTLLNPIAYPESTTTYTFFSNDIRNPDDLWDTSSVTITVNNCEYDCSLHIEQDRTICCGDSAELEIVVTGECLCHPIEYIWSIDDSVISSGSPSIFVSPPIPTEYNVAVTMDCDEGQFDLFSEILVDVQEWDLEIIPGDTAISLGDTLALHAYTNEVCENLSYLWTINEPDSSKIIDVVFVLDTTGSMIFYLDSLFLAIPAFIDSLDSDSFDYRLGLVTFGDGRNIADFDLISPGIQMTDNSDAFLARLDSVESDGGSDYTEQSLDAIADAINLYEWRTEAKGVAICLTDAPYCQVIDPCDDCNLGTGIFADSAAQTDTGLAAQIESKHVKISLCTKSTYLTSCGTFSSPVPWSPYGGTGFLGWYQYFSYLSGGYWYDILSVDWLPALLNSISSDCYRLTSQDIEISPKNNCDVALVVTNEVNRGECIDSASIEVSINNSLVIFSPETHEGNPSWIPDTVEHRGDYVFLEFPDFMRLVNNSLDTLQIGLSVNDSTAFWKLATHVGDTSLPRDTTLCYYNCYSISAIFAETQPDSSMFSDTTTLIQPDVINWSASDVFGGMEFLPPGDSTYLWLRIDTPPWYSIGEEAIQLKVSHQVWSGD